MSGCVIYDPGHASAHVCVCDPVCVILCVILVMLLLMDSGKESPPIFSFTLYVRVWNRVSMNHKMCTCAT
jgi:hypothetical protein